MNNPHPQTTHSVVMVRPYDFAFNQQTGLDNEFQQQPQIATEQLRSLVMAEFDAMVEQLTRHNIEVLVLDKPSEQPLPDAIFPNNWFSTNKTNQLFIYPMKTENRRNEVRVAELIKLFKTHGYTVQEIIDLRPEPDWQPSHIVEGTGSLIFNHTNRWVYCAQSERCHPQAVKQFCERFNYQPMLFNSELDSGLPVYHTNVLMSCGTEFVVICLEAITKDQRAKVKACLAQQYETIIEISTEQMTSGFCGNVLELKSQAGEPLLVLSESAFNAFNARQISSLEQYVQLVPCAIPHIEQVGGGSARCMIAENFLTKQEST